MKILVPIDSSETSFAAYAYARNLAFSLKAELVLIKVMEGSFHTNEPLSFNPIVEASEKALKALKYFAEDYPRDYKLNLPEVKISYVVRFGIPGFTISDYASDNGLDLIIMGSRNKRSIVQKILGTTSTITLKTSKVPVMIVHKETQFNLPKKIVFAIDGINNIEGAVNSINKINQTLLAKVDFIHINNNKNTDLTKAKTEIIESLFVNNTPSYAYEVKAIEGENVSVSVKDYCMFGKADLLALVHRDQGIFESLFNKSFSINMAQEFHLPVIVFPESKT